MLISMGNVVLIQDLELGAWRKCYGYSLMEQSSELILIPVQIVFVP